MTATAGKNMVFDISTGKWLSTAGYGLVPTPPTIKSVGTFLTTASPTCLYAYRTGGNLVIRETPTNYNLHPQDVSIDTVNEGPYSGIQPEFWQQHLDMATDDAKVLLVFDGLGGRLFSIDGASSTPSLVLMTNNLTPVPATNTPVAWAFDAKRRRSVFAYPASVRSTLLIFDHYTGLVSIGPALPSGITYFDRALWHAASDKIYFWGNDTALTDKLYPFSFASTDYDSSDQSLSSRTLPFDGRSGVTGTWWNAWLRLPWENSGGDWYDSTGTTQGTSQFATFPTSGTLGLNTTHQTFSLSASGIVSLVQSWVTNGNTGALIKPSGSLWLATGRTPVTAERPALTVNGINCPLLYSGSLSGANFNQQLGIDPTQMPGTSFVYFDLSGISGAVTSAVLTMTKVRAADNSQPAKIYRLRAPTFKVDTYTPVGGSTIASQYVFDAGLPTDPDVYAYEDFRDSSWPVRLAKWVPSGPQLPGGGWIGSVNDSFFNNGPVGRWAFLYGQNTPESARLSLRTLLGSGAGPSELWVRYYFLRELDMASNVTGNKWPGFGGQNELSSAYQPGNGQTAGTGYLYSNILPGTFSVANSWFQYTSADFAWDYEFTKHSNILVDIRFATTGVLPSPLVVGTQYQLRKVSSQTAEIWTAGGGSRITLSGTPSGAHTARDNTFGTGLGTTPSFMGWSMRNHNGGSEAIDPNPYRKLDRRFVYLYGETNGQMWGDGSGLQLETNIFPAITKRNRWYCIEEHLKMNTINVSTVDRFGNGAGATDGVYEMWIDDQLVLQKTDIRLSHNPGYQILQWWMDCQHGGLSDCQAQHTFRMAHLTIARRKVGLMRSS